MERGRRRTVARKRPRQVRLRPNEHSMGAFTRVVATFILLPSLSARLKVSSYILARSRLPLAVYASLVTQLLRSVMDLLTKLAPDPKSPLH